MRGNHPFRIYTIKGSISNMSIFSSMDYWHEIVESYDDPQKNGTRGKDHGKFSRKIAVMLLIYLALGTDYSTGIAKYFGELNRESPDKQRSSVLMNANKISSVLKTMNEDKLVILSKKVSVGAAPRSYYVLNPQILQSPIKDVSTYITDHTSIFTIPLETIEDFLAWLALKQAGIIEEGKQKELDEKLRLERHKQADEILEELIHQKIVDYFQFLQLIENKARIWDLERKFSSQQPAFGNLISDYISEINYYKDDG
jgi:hypothetical protein